MLSDARRGEAYPVLWKWASTEDIRHHWRRWLSSWPSGFWRERYGADWCARPFRARSRERLFHPLPISLPVPVPAGRRLREGAGQRVQDAQPRQRQEIERWSTTRQKRRLSRLSAIAARSVMRPGTSPRGDRIGPRQRGARANAPRRLPRQPRTRPGSGLPSSPRRRGSSHGTRQCDCIVDDHRLGARNPCLSVYPDRDACRGQGSIPLVRSQRRRLVGD
jgi:hypothetical protein